MELRNGNSLEMIKTIPVGKVKCIITDPPYELAEGSGGGLMKDPGRKFVEDLNKADLVTGFNVAEFLDMTINLFEKDHYNAVYFCSNKQLVHYINWAIANDLRYGVGVWHKTNPAPLCGGKYLNDVEYWLYIKGKKARIHGSYATKSMVYTSAINKTDKKLYGHPTPKPVELMTKFVLNHTQEDDVIFDPFMGVGSTGVAAQNLNRDFFGIEISEEWFNTSKERVNPTLSQFF